MFTISSDHHCHKWSQFSKTNDDGVNSRLRVILDELLRQAEYTAQEDVSEPTMLLAGDLFHVRGSIDPEVLNPVIECFQKISDMGVKVYAIAGNHDLAGKFTSKLGNAMQALDQIEGFTAITEPTHFRCDGFQVFMVPWIEDLAELRAVLKKGANKGTIAVIHAPVNGVIKGIPANGLTPKELGDLRYKAVFVGHYHNHKDFGNGVYSVGATTHQTWNDPDTAAGFIEMVKGHVVHHPSEAPEFINIKMHSDLSDKVRGAYCRIQLQNPTDDLLQETIDYLKSNGCAGFVDHSVKTKEVTRKGQSSAGTSTKVAVATYVAKTLDTGEMSKKKIAVEAIDILAEAEQREAAK